MTCHKNTQAARRSAVASLADIHARCIEVGECWEWGGAVSANGIPCVCLPTVYPKHPSMRSRRVGVHILAWEAATGKFAFNKTIWRTCCNSACVNPAHLRSGTREQMAAQLVSLGVYRRTPASIAAITKGKRKDAKLTLEKVREIRASDMNNSELSRIYGVHTSMVQRIRAGQAWRETVGVASIFSLGAA